MKVKAIGNNHYFILLFVTVVFFVIYNFLNLTVWLPKYLETNHLIFTWPDAMANSAFIDKFIETTSFAIPEPDNSIANNVIHPRSVNIYFGALVPVSFLGFPLIFGLLGKAIGSFGLLLINPLLGVLSALLFYEILKRIISSRAALISAILFLSAAPVIYYSAIGPLNSILFIFLLLLGFFLIGKINESKNRWPQLTILLASLAVNLALTVRYNELIWIYAIVIIIFIRFREAHPIRQILTWLLGLLLAIVPIAWQNQILFGSFWQIGYLKNTPGSTLMDRLPGELAQSGGNFVTQVLHLLFLPFGFHPRVLWNNVWEFILIGAAPLIILSLLGLIVLLIKKHLTKHQTTYILITGGTLFLLLMYYGNWNFIDGDILKYNTISSSYVRYWLPIYILLIPSAGYFLSELFERQKSRPWPKIIAVILFISTLAYSFYWAFAAPRDGLSVVRHDLGEYYERYKITAKVIESEAILITDKTDKIFFPKYDVVVYQFDNTIFPSLSKIIDSRPIYYITMMDDTAINKLNREVLTTLNLEIKYYAKVDDVYRLFSLDKLNKK